MSQSYNQGAFSSNIDIGSEERNNGTTKVHHDYDTGI